MSKQITALMGSGADAFKNMYDVEIKFPWNEAEITTTVRATGFKNPEAKVTTYDKKYHGVTIKAVAPEIDFTREFQITFRLDAAYNLYGQFVTWLSTVGDIASGGVANWAPVLGKITVRGLSGAYSAANYPGLTDSTDDGILDGTNATWTYDQVAVVGVSQPEFSTGDAAALEYNVSFIFGETTAPFFNSTGIAGV